MASAWWQDIGDKLFSIGKFLVPGLALLELVQHLVSKWWGDLMADWSIKLATSIGTLSVDLAPPADVMLWIARFNSVVPLSEAWGYTIKYLAIASAVLGVKWARNLIPGMS